MLQNRATRQSRATRRWVITYSLLVAISLVLIAVSSAAPIQELRRGVIFAMSPIQGALSGATRSATSIFDAIGQIDQLRKENRSLTDQVSALETQMQQLETLRTENDRLSALLGIKATLHYNTVVGDVIGRQTTDQERVITLDRGTDDGVLIDDPVLSEGGALVGVVSDAGRNYASVLLISDPRSLVIGQDVQTRSTGELVGHLSGLLALSNIPTTQQIAKDDTIVTAGEDLGGSNPAAFPHGLLIGSVVEVDSDASAVVQTALIVPTANLDDLEHVLVITDFTPPPTSSPSPSPKG